MTEALVVEGTFASESGASGFVRMMDPKLKLDVPESLTMFVAYTLAYTELPQSMLKGLARNKDIGTVHFVAAITLESAPLQLTVS